MGSVFGVLINVFEDVINIYEGAKNIYEVLKNRPLTKQIYNTWARMSREMGKKS